MKVVLAALVILGVAWGMIVNWLPGGEAGLEAFLLFVCAPIKVLHGQVWRLLTAGLLTAPTGSGAVSHLVFTVIALYFLTPDLERRWGSARFARFLFISIVLGYALAIALDVIAPPQSHVFHPGGMFGAGAAITATAVAWSRENAEREVRLFLLVPVKGKVLFWFTIGYCVLTVVLGDQTTEGVVAPFGGVLTGLMLGGSPSPLRALFLQTKLAMLKKQAGVGGQPGPQKAARRPRPGAPPLRVVQGGLDEDLSKREPPKDKRYLN
jgi:membrane associated rhomboid family serine protease